jgi:tetratricopeptide (TPR) repeat protein
MGSPQFTPTALAEPPSAFSFEAANVAAWLDGLAATLASGGITPWHAEGVRGLLREIPFDAVLSAVDRARPNRDDPPEIALYTQWIEANAGSSPLLFAAWFNLGVSLARAGNQRDAATAYRNALVLRPDMLGAAINLGLLLEAAGEPEQALATWKRATQSDDARNALEIQQGRLLERLGRFEEAEIILRRVLATNPAQPDVVHHWVHIRQKICQWPVAHSDVPGITDAQLLESAGPLGILALTSVSCRRSIIIASSVR